MLADLLLMYPCMQNFQEMSYNYGSHLSGLPDLSLILHTLGSGQGKFCPQHFFCAHFPSVCELSVMRGM